MQENWQHHRILITGSKGLIGHRLKQMLEQQGAQVDGFDINYSIDHPDYGDICQYSAVANAVKKVSGIIHLAGVSRVIWGEKDPQKCLTVNIDGTENILKAALAADPKPWVMYASSREVYGEQKTLPVNEEAALQPCNVYAESKVEAEKLLVQYRAQGVPTGILRFSNVYGAVHDHHDRVVPAFCRNAIRGLPLQVEGGQNTFDFTHVDDVVAGILLAIKKLHQDKILPTLHFTSQVGTTLEELANLITRLVGSQSEIKNRAARNFDVAHFVGCAARSHEILGWRAKTPLAKGLKALIDAHTQLLLSTPSVML
jgi:UDP-glucose 4-epimerase